MPLERQKKKFITHWELREFLKGLKKTIGWFNTLGSRYGAVPSPVIQSQLSIPVHEWRLTSEKRKHKIFEKRGRVFLYHSGVKQLIRDIIREHEQNDVPYAQIAEKFRSRVSEINIAMGCLNVDAKKRRDCSKSRLRDIGFFQNFQASLARARIDGFFNYDSKYLTGLKFLGEDAARLGEIYQKMLLDKGSSSAGNSSELKRLGNVLDYLHAVTDTTIRFFYNDAHKHESGVGDKQVMMPPIKQSKRKGGGEAK